MKQLTIDKLLQRESVVETYDRGSMATSVSPCDVVGKVISSRLQEITKLTEDELMEFVTENVYEISRLSFEWSEKKHQQELKKSKK